MPDLFRTHRVAIALLTAIVVSSTLYGFAQTAAPPASDDTSQSLAVRDSLNRGVEAYKAARYGEAAEHFRHAVELAPSLAVAKLYLGTALAQNVVPGLDTPENLKTAEEAIATFREVLKANPEDSDSMKQVAAIYFQIKRLDDARQWQMKVLALEPRDADAAYTIGVIDWTLAYQSLLSLLAPTNTRDDGEGNRAAPADAMSRFREQNTAIVDEGITYLKKATEDRPAYADAMLYLNLVYRLKASLDRDDEPLRNADVLQANEWTTKAMSLRFPEKENLPAVAR